MTSILAQRLPPVMRKMHLVTSSGLIAIASFRQVLAAPSSLVSERSAKLETIDPADKYIITLKSGVNVTVHLSFAQGLHGNDATTGGLLGQYDIGNFQGYYGHYNKTTIEQIKRHDDVAAVEKDQSWTPSRMTAQYNSPNYGLGHISHRALRDPSLYIYDSSAGAGTYAYILDSGINDRHIDFEGRARLGHNTMQYEQKKDTTGHGTHIAGLIGSKTFGVAKQCKMIAVKVVYNNRANTGVTLRGYQWAVQHILQYNRRGNSVINISVNGPPSGALDNAVREAYGRGILTVVSAGNNGGDARQYAPGVGTALVVAAADRYRRRASFSNGGPGVSLFGPGVEILSTWIGSDRATSRQSGTSMAAAHVAGMVLYLKVLYPRRMATAAQARSYVINTATTQAVGRVGDAPNKFAYNGSGS
ncbi:extracellular alkaline serine protease [Myriangium duriaei CBS 260.36]|uniref:Extracellular alkaline serine protease n=1 Tax=Myriangium duriaei CBS 260.36 TaxID=1168546 RepID=A0A9P4J9B5_9PEZI|nr:extracellular alkaline serine protease [Myriangium duriaei CBS 260.36]